MRNFQWIHNLLMMPCSCLLEKIAIWSIEKQVLRYVLTNIRERHIVFI